MVNRLTQVFLFRLKALQNEGKFGVSNLLFQNTSSILNFNTFCWTVSQLITVVYQLQKISNVLWGLVFPNSFLCSVHIVPVEFHPPWAHRLCTVLCWTSETYLCQWSTDWTSELAGTSGSNSLFTQLYWSVSFYTGLCLLTCANRSS